MCTPLPCAVGPQWATLFPSRRPPIQNSRTGPTRTTSRLVLRTRASVTARSREGRREGQKGAVMPASADQCIASPPPPPGPPNVRRFWASPYNATPKAPSGRLRCTDHTSRVWLLWGDVRVPGRLSKCARSPPPPSHSLLHLCQASAVYGPGTQPRHTANALQPEMPGTYRTAPLMIRPPPPPCDITSGCC